MHPLIELIKKDMVPALGVTEPGCIARVFDSYPLILELQNIHIAFT